MKYLSDIAFTDSVKNVQTRKGSRKTYEKHANNAGYYPEITSDLEAFIARQDSVYVATVNADGQPYIQHRGGPPGFVKVMDKKTLAFADYKGNRQFITTGNLDDNPKAFLFMVDYIRRDRIKFWGTAEMIENDPALLSSLMPSSQNYRARPEQVFMFRMSAWDRNCPQHIPARVDLAAAQAMLADKDREIQALKERLGERE